MILYSLKFREDPGVAWLSHAINKEDDCLTPGDMMMERLNPNDSEHVSGRSPKKKKHSIDKGGLRDPGVLTRPDGGLDAGSGRFLRSMTQSGLLTSRSCWRNRATNVIDTLPAFRDAMAVRRGRPSGFRYGMRTENIIHYMPRPGRIGTISTVPSEMRYGFA